MHIKGLNRAKRSILSGKVVIKSNKNLRSIKKNSTKPKWKGKKLDASVIKNLVGSTKNYFVDE